MFSIILNILLTITAVILGFYLLTAGGRFLWATAGVVMTVSAANLSAILIARVDSGWELVETNNWQLVLPALIIGLIGVLLGKFRPAIAAAIVGFLAGADLALLFYDIAIYLFDQVAALPENTILWIGVVLLFVGGIPFLYLTRRYSRRALILISVLVGVQIIDTALNLNPSSNLTAVILLGLTLLGVVAQYADYTRGIQQRRPLGVAAAPIDETFNLDD